MGSEQSAKSLLEPSLATCCMATMMFLAEATRSMAPPMPFTILPGIFQLAMSPRSLTSIAPRMVKSTCSPRIMPNESAELKMLEPGSVVTVCLPALMRSGSTWASVGKGPMPSRPFSDCSSTLRPAGM